MNVTNDARVIKDFKFLLSTPARISVLNRYGSILKVLCLILDHSNVGIFKLSFFYNLPFMTVGLSHYYM